MSPKVIQLRWQSYFVGFSTLRRPRLYHNRINIDGKGPPIANHSGQHRCLPPEMGREVFIAYPAFVLTAGHPDS